MIITPLLKLAVERNASDLIFSVDAPINIKIDGVAKPINDQKVDSESARRIAYEMMTPDQIAQFEREFEMNFSFRVPDVGSFRVNVFLQKGDVSMVRMCPVVMLLRCSIMEASVVDFPELVAPTIRIRPRFSMTRFFSTMGRFSSSTLSTLART